MVAKAGLLIAAVLLCSAAAGCGGASGPRAELSRFVVDYVDENRHNCCEAGLHVTESRITFARSDPRWAAVSMSVTVNGEPDGESYLVARRTGSTWQVIGFGHGALGCGVPARLRAELAGGVPDSVLHCPAGG